MDKLSPPDANRLSHRLRGYWLGLWELLGSMRLAVGLLTLLAIASIAGTLTAQNQPYINYVNQFGPFWADFFIFIQFNELYEATWFIVVLAFLVLSTSICVWRNTPKMVREIAKWRENLRITQLQRMPLYREINHVDSITKDALITTLASLRYRVRHQEREDGFALTARKGHWTRLGYIFTHTAIILICLGGLIDSQVGLQLYVWWHKKVPYTGQGLIKDIPEHSWLSERTPSFRGNIGIVENQTTDFVFLNRDQGLLLQKLPFDLTLDRFFIEHYANGMPKRFVSELTIAEPRQAPVKMVTEVNHPAIYKGYTIFQSSFSDGGSRLKVTPWMLSGAGVGTVKPTVEVAVGDTIPIARFTEWSEPLTLEVTDFRPFNVNPDLSAQDSAQQEKSRQVTSTVPNKKTGAGGGVTQAASHQLKVGSEISGVLDQFNQIKQLKIMKNAGPSFFYKLRDNAGQAREFEQYMLPMNISGNLVQVIGVRSKPSDPFEYIWIPVDANRSVQTWFEWLKAMHDPTARRQAVDALMKQRVALGLSPEEQNKERQLIVGLMDLFAGQLPQTQQGGMQAIQLLAEGIFAPEKRQQGLSAWIQTIYLVSEMVLSQMQTANPVAKEAALKDQKFLINALSAMSDGFSLRSPFYLQLKEFKLIRRSEFQITKMPGRNVVYFGSLLLVVGVFLMVFMREKNLWMIFSASTQTLHIALLAPKQTLDVESEFSTIHRLVQNIAKLTEKSLSA